MPRRPAVLLSVLALALLAGAAVRSGSGAEPDQAVQALDLPAPTATQTTEAPAPPVPVRLLVASKAPLVPATTAPPPTAPPPPPPPAPEPVVAAAVAEPVPTPAPAPPPPPPPPPASSSGDAARLHELHNQARAEAGVGPLQRNGCLDAVAQAWAEHLAASGGLAHQDLGAVLDCGGGAAGENVASNYSADAAQASWMSSGGHRTNILNGTYTQAGFGVAVAGDGTMYFVVDFVG